MLILTRRPNEAFIIELPTGETIKVAVLSVKPDLVRLYLSAPDDIKIIKEEMVLGLDMERLMLAEKHKKGSDEEVIRCIVDGSRKQDVNYDKRFACHKNQVDAAYNLAFCGAGEGVTIKPKVDRSGFSRWSIPVWATRTHLTYIAFS